MSFAWWERPKTAPMPCSSSRRHRPDLVLMDIGLPGLNGVETTAEILRHHPECKVVILSMYDDENSVVSAIRSGARAFILKKASDTDLLEALRMVARGGAYLSPQVSDRLLTRIQKGDLESQAGASPRWKCFRRANLQVLRMVAEGKTSKEIAVMLDLREQTVRSYRKTMMKKLGVNNVAGLTQLALSTGLTQLPARPSRTNDPIERVARESPLGGAIAVADAHVHFFLAPVLRIAGAQEPGLTVRRDRAQLDWQVPPAEAREAGRDLGARTGSPRRGARGADRQHCRARNPPSPPPCARIPTASSPSPW